MVGTGRHRAFSIAPLEHVNDSRQMGVLSFSSQAPLVLGCDQKFGWGGFLLRWRVSLSELFVVDFSTLFVVVGVVATSNRKPPLRILIWPHSVGDQARRLASCQIGKHKLRYGWPDYFWIGDYSLGIRRTGSPAPGVRLTLCRGFQWLIPCSPNQKPQDNRWFAQR